MRNSFIAISIVLGAAGVVHAQHDASAEPASPSSAGVEEPAQTEAIDEGAGPAAEVVIDFSVTSDPEGARVIVDRRVVGVTPLDTQLAIPADATSLRVTVEADGYQPRTREVSPRGGSVVVDTALARLPPAGGGSPAASAAPAWGSVDGERAPAEGSGWQPESAPPALRPRHFFRAGLGFFTMNNDRRDKLTTLTLTLDGSFRLLGDDAQGELTMDLLARWSFGSIFAGDLDPEARPNNPTLSMMFGSQFGTMRIYGGPGITLPVAAAIDESGSYSAPGLLSRYVAGAMRGFVEPWEFQHSHLGLHARVGTEARFDVGHIGGEMALGFMPGIEANYNDVDGFFGWQLRIFGAARPAPIFSVGGELAIVYLRNLDAPDYTSASIDEFFVSLEPYVRFHFGAGFFGARFLLNLTDNIGFSFDEGKIWSMTLEGGVALE